MKIALTVIMLVTSQLTIPPVHFYDSMHECIDEKERIENSFIVTVFRGIERSMIDMAKGKYKIVCSIVN